MTARWIEDEDGSGAFVEVPFTRKRKMSETQELLPCPFCGGEARLSDALAGKEGMSLRVRNPRCSKCGVDHGYYNDAQSDREGWNRRAPLPDYERLLEVAVRVEEYIDAIVCYASTCDEYEPNAIAVEFRAAIQAIREKAK